MKMKCFTSNIVIFVILPIIIADTGDNRKAVLDEILVTRQYNKHVKPVIDQQDIIEVMLDFNLNSIVEFNERTETLTTAGYLSIMWYDQFLVWSPEAFNGTDELIVPQDKVWKPDITLRNSFATIQQLGSSSFNVHLQFDGYVVWFPLQVFQSTCSVSVVYFPFDVQTCSLRFSAWSYSKNGVILRGYESIRLDEYSPSASWNLVGTATREVAYDDSEFIFDLILKRKPRFYVINIIIPLILLSVMNVFSFMLPVTSGERAGYSITVFLSLAIFLTIVSEQLPQNSESTPLMSIYILTITALSTFTVLLCLIQLRMQSWYDTEQPVSRFFKGFVRVCDNIRCKRCKKSSVGTTVESASKTDFKNASNTELESMAEQPVVTWLDVINAMDFIFFLISFMYTFICTLVILTAIMKNM